MTLWKDTVEAPHNIKNRTGLHDPAIPLPSIYLKETKTTKLKGKAHIHWVVLFTITKTWNNLSVHRIGRVDKENVGLASTCTQTHSM